MNKKVVEIANSRIVKLGDALSDTQLVLLEDTIKSRVSSGIFKL